MKRTKGRWREDREGWKKRVGGDDERCGSRGDERKSKFKIKKEEEGWHGDKNDCRDMRSERNKEMRFARSKEGKKRGVKEVGGRREEDRKCVQRVGHSCMRVCV